jgi:FAD/FMN-containing dehydrogenase
MIKSKILSPGWNDSDRGLFLFEALGDIILNMMNLKEEIKKIIKGEVQDDEETLKKYSRDASLLEIRPRLVVFPQDSADVKALVKFVAAHPAEHLELSPRSAGTDMTGGPLTESIVMDFTRHMNAIKEVTDDYVITEPGVYYRDLDTETLKRSRIMPTYPASRGLCAVGGMVGNNAGGEKNLIYGKTENFVLGLKMVWSDGEEYEIRPLNETELKTKIAQSDREGEVYRAIYELIDRNYDLIKKAKPQVSKNSAGYYLWNVWDKEIFNLNKLFVGSQGTLGVITEIKFGLVKPKEHSTLLVVFLKDLKPLVEVVNRILKFKPESMESYDDNTVRLAMRYVLDFIKLLKLNVFNLGWRFLPEAWMMLTGGTPKLVMLAEFTGDSEDEILKKATEAQTAIADLNVKTHITTSDKEEQKYFTIRRESFSLLRYHIKGKRTAPFIDDFIVRPDLLPEFMPKLSAILAEYPKLIYTIAGHVGDGNFHIIPLMDMSDPKNREIIPELSRRVYDLVIKYHGSITAEHNDGLIRTPFLEQMYGKEIIALFEKTKDIFDPQNIFNSKKKVRGDLDYTMKHLATHN